MRCSTSYTIDGKPVKTLHEVKALYYKEYNQGFRPVVAKITVTEQDISDKLESIEDKRVADWDLYVRTENARFATVG